MSVQLETSIAFAKLNRESEMAIFRVRQRHAILWPNRESENESRKRNGRLQERSILIRFRESEIPPRKRKWPLTEYVDSLLPCDFQVFQIPNTTFIHIMQL